MSYKQERFHVSSITIEKVKREYRATVNLQSNYKKQKSVRFYCKKHLLGKLVGKNDFWENDWYELETSEKVRFSYTVHNYESRSMDNVTITRFQLDTALRKHLREGK